MSHNQYRQDKSEATQSRRVGRSAASGNQRSFFSNASAVKGGGGGGGGGIAGATLPPSTAAHSNRGVNKPSNAGAQSYHRISTSSGLISDSAANVAFVQRGLQNGALGPPPSHRGGGGGRDGIATKENNRHVVPSSTQKVARTDPKISSSSHTSSDSAPPLLPAKADGYKGMSFQFGSFAPSLMNGMQVPARTSSAPPNLDEQKHEQASHDSRRVTPPIPIPSVPKQQISRRVMGPAASQTKSTEATPLPKSAEVQPLPKSVEVQQLPKPAEVQPLPKSTEVQPLPKSAEIQPLTKSVDVQALLKPKKEAPTVAAPAMPTLKQPVHAPSVISTHMSLPSPQVSIQFGTPLAHIQQQSINMSLPLHLPMGTTNAPPSQKQMFVPGNQHHMVQSQGIMAQGHAMNYPHQMAPQLPPQLGSIGIGMGLQYLQQQTGNFGNTRKPVKITDPNTHEELKLEKRQDTYTDGGSSVMRSHSIVPPPQPQTMPPFNIYGGSYGPGVYYQAPTSHPLTGGQLNSNLQGQRFGFQPNQISQAGQYISQSSLSLPASRAGIAQFNHESLRPEPVISYSMTPSVQVTVKPPPAPVTEKVGVSSLSISSSTIKRTETQSTKTSEDKNSGRDVNNVVTSSAITSPNATTQSHDGAQFSLSSKPLASEPESFSLECSSSSTAVLPATKPSSPPEKSMLISTLDEGSIKECHILNGNLEEPESKVHSQLQNQDESTSLPPVECNDDDVFDKGIDKTVIEKEIRSSENIEESLPKLSQDAALLVDQVALSTSRSETECSFTEDKLSEICNESLETECSFTKAKLSEICNESLIVSATEALKSAMEDDISPPHTEEAKLDITGDPQEGDKSPRNIKDDYECTVDSSVSHDTTDVVAKQANEFPRNEKFLANDGDAGIVIKDSEGASVNVDNTVSVGLETLPKVEELASVVDSTKSDGIIGEEDMGGKSDILSREISIPNVLEECVQSEDPSTEIASSCYTSLPLTNSKDKPARELIRSTSTSLRGKKKMREVLQKADAAGEMSDLYMAYKGPEEQKDSATSLESTGSISRSNSKDISTDVLQNSIVESKMGGNQIKYEPEDWEDAADTPKLEHPGKERVRRRAHLQDEDGPGMVMRYSRDFLLTLEHKFLCIPDDFVYHTDCDDFMAIGRNSGPSKNTDRHTGMSRPDRRGGGLVEEDKWGKHSGSFGFGRDSRPEAGYPVSVGGAGPRPGQGGNYGVLKNPRGQASVGGILSGPMQSVGPQGGNHRMSSDSDRWMRPSGLQKGLIPPPHVPSMHKAEKKYEVGKVTDEEQSKQRLLKAILNKLTPQNFEKLFEQVKAVNIDSAVTLTGVISQIFDKALMEPTFCEMYANFCSRLSADLPDFNEDNERITFRRLLLNKCQEEFERGEREQQEAEEEGEIKQSEGEREEKRLKARRRMLGNIRLIGELYKKKMLTERIMHECITKLLGQNQIPEEEDLESLCKLMSTIGEMIDHTKAKEHIDAYFGRMIELSNDMKFSSRVRFMLKDSIDLRRNKWQQRRKVEGPKKIEEVHRDAAQERHEASRMARGPTPSSSSRRPLEFAPRGSNMSLNSSSIGSHRGPPSHSRSFASQDVRSDDRHPYESKPLSVPLTQRSFGDDSIALLPQGGLARVMSTRGQVTPSINHHLADSSSLSAEPNRSAPLMNGTTFGPRSGRFSSENSGAQERVPSGSKDMRCIDPDMDRPIASTPPIPVTAPNNSAISLSEEHVLRMSMYAIKEFYSANDEKEVALCLKELNAPTFSSMMIAKWVMDSFERKDVERERLGKLLVNLSKSHDNMLKQAHIIKGFEVVLESLEDAVNDAPKAAEYLGRLFGRVVIENVVSMGEMGRLIYEGGEQQGNLREVGLAAEVLGNMLEMIKAERGDSMFAQIFTASSLHLEDFNHPDVCRSRKLLMFI